MSTRIAINGLGRIGRAILKLVIDEPSFELVAVNDLVEVKNLAYLLRFDTVYGRYSKPVFIDNGDLVVTGRKVRTLRSRDPWELPWKELSIDLVFECTGALAGREDLEKHLRAGARIVLVSAPSNTSPLPQSVAAESAVVQTACLVRTASSCRC
jgi:glyceraldehyde 3-phosphate dehydrogenase (phosphorylating)